MTKSMSKPGVKSSNKTISGEKPKRPATAKAVAAPVKRTYLRQTDIPNASLDEALRIPTALFDHYAGKATSPFNVAKALDVDPKGSQLRLLSGAAIAFGLIEGGAQAATISVTDLARRIIRPNKENDDILAKREAILKPRIFLEFLGKYDGHQFPRADVAMNVLEEFGVPRDKVQDVLSRVEESARSIGFLQNIKGKSYVKLDLTDISDGGVRTGSLADEDIQPSLEVNGADDPEQISSPETASFQFNPSIKPLANVPRSAALTVAIADDQRRRRVFITHGKDRALVEPIKKLLEYGELEPVISIERQSVSKPVPEKFIDDMRKSGAAIIHVDAEKIVTDKDGVEHVILNPNVLIEIGAAMAFYGRRFILLVRDGVKLPSNLQGLYEVRYSGDTLDATSTIKLLEAIRASSR